MSLDETSLMTAIDRLRDKNLVYLFYGSGSRAVKYKHMLPNVYDLESGGVAIVAALVLRGPQTIGELRERTGRLHEFGGLGEVQEMLDELARRDEPLVIKLERQPGQKEARYAHLLCGEIDQDKIASSRDSSITSTGGGTERISKLENEVESLRSELSEFRVVFDEFRKQFD